MRAFGEKARAGRGARRSGLLAASLLTLVAALVGGLATGRDTAHAVSVNPIVLENQQPGTTAWQLTNFNKATHHEIEGYASLTSVDKGDPIDLMVSLSSNAQYTMDVFRMGWYPTGTNPDGSSCAPSCGGRLMLHLGPFDGFPQPTCPQVTNPSSADYGLTECHWAPSYTLTVPTSWTTGNYIVKLRRLDGTHLESYLTFVVRDDANPAPIVYSLDVSTWQAYNYWGGAGNGNVGFSLYSRLNDVNESAVDDSRAYTVSFDRPYLDNGSTDGAGTFMVWDFPMIRWLESRGYDVTYIADVDLEASPSVLSGHRVFANTGHDEYYSDGMRQRIQDAIGAGTDMAFFSANNMYFRTTFAPSAAGAPLRRIQCDKWAHPGSTTGEFQYLTPPRPSNQLSGVMSSGVATARPFLVADASSWIYAGTGLATYAGNGTSGVVTSGAGQNALAGLVGYEFDTRAVNDAALAEWAAYEPPGVTQVGHSFVPASDNGRTAWSDATLYTAPSGATVFSAGTLQWSFGLDDGFDDGFCDCNHHVASAAVQRITANILDRFTAPTTPTPALSAAPSSLTFDPQLVATTSAARTVVVTNTGTAPLTIAGIAATGANAGDFALSDTCPRAPATLAANATCTIGVTFTPSAAGARAASVTVTDDAPGSPHGIALAGTGHVPAPAVGLAPGSLAFGSRAVGTTSAPATPTLTNSGDAPLTITSLAVSGPAAADYAQTTTCPLAPSTLAPGGSCSIAVTFTPSASGARTATLGIADDAAGSPQSVALSGSGAAAAAPNATLTPTALSFGTVLLGTETAIKTTVLKSTGTAPLHVASVTLAPASDFAIRTDTCSGATLAVNATCTVGVTFTPTAAGARSGQLNVADDAAGSPQPVALSGTGQTADVRASATANRTSVAVGGRITFTATATNLGPGRATGIALTDELPAGTTFASASWSSTSATCTTPAVGATGTVTCRPNNSTASLAANGTLKVTIVVTVGAGARPAAIDRVTASTPLALGYDPETGNNTAAVSVAVA